MLAACALVLWIVSFFAAPTHFSSALLRVIFAFGGWLFSSLTVCIEEGWLKWSFGPGLIRKKVPLADIESAEPVRNSWSCGWGIHYTPGGWLYNVSGMEAVRIVIKNGKRFRLGTDEPRELAEAIKAELGATG